VLVGSYPLENTGEYYRVLELYSALRINLELVSPATVSQTSTSPNLSSDIKIHIANLK